MQSVTAQRLCMRGVFIVVHCVRSGTLVVPGAWRSMSNDITQPNASFPAVEQSRSESSKLYSMMTSFGMSHQLPGT